MSNQVLIDVSAAVVPFSTGIQRVIRGLVTSWPPNEYQLIVWDDALNRFREPMSSELDRLHYEELSGGNETLGHDLAEAESEWLLIPDFVHEPRRRQALRELATAKRLRVAYFVHDCVPVTVPETTIQQLTPAFFDYLEEVAASDLVFTNSQETASELGATFALMGVVPDEGPDVVVAHLPDDSLLIQAQFVAPKSLDASTQDLRPKRLSEGDEPRVLCVGSSEPRKNHGAVFYACERLWQEGFKFHLDLVASRSWSNQDELSWYADLVQRKRPVHWYTDITDEQLCDMYRRSDLVLLPSIHEGFGLPVIEALSFGVPVVASKFGATGQMAEEGGCLVIDPNSDEDLVSTLRQLLSDQGLLRELRSAASKRVRRPAKDCVADVRAALGLAS